MPIDDPHTKAAFDLFLKGLHVHEDNPHSNLADDYQVLEARILADMGVSPGMLTGPPTYSTTGMAAQGHEAMNRLYRQLYGPREPPGDEK